jgi:hypothetical protein
MPGLLRGVARTAVIAGTATHVSNNVSRRQANRWASKEQQQAPQQEEAPQQYQAPPPPEAAPAPDMDAKLAQLKELGALKEAGVLTDFEFETQKNRILNG